MGPHGTCLWSPRWAIEEVREDEDRAFQAEWTAWRAQGGHSEECKGILWHTATDRASACNHTPQVRCFGIFWSRVHVLVLILWRAELEAICKGTAE